MIARIWKAQAEAARVKDYVAHFETRVFPELRQIMGFQGVYVLEHALADVTEIQVVTLWESMEAIREFAGEQVDQAVVEPEAQAVLQSFDTTVSHHEVLVKH